jgi:hypothetical protein
MIMKRFLSLTLVLATAVLLACGGGRETAEYEEEEMQDDGAVVESAESGDAEAAPAAAAPAAVADAATVSGLVKLEGAPAPASTLQMGADPNCQSQHSSPVPQQEVLVGPAGELANVFIYVKDFKGTVAPPSTPALLNQQGCLYIPHVSGIQVNQPLQIKNSDATLHNVHCLAKVNKEFNEGQPVQGMVATKTFSKPEVMMKFKCDVHSWMSSYMAVLPHPYFSVSGNGGNFSISNLPPGTYTVEAWHEKYGTQTQQITVGPKEAKQINFVFKTA